MRTVVFPIILTTVLAATAAAADLLVIASDVPELAAGTEIRAEDELVIPQGASITLVAENGDAITLNGPFSGVPGGQAAEATPGLFDALKRLFTTLENYESDLGAAKGIKDGAIDELEDIRSDKVWMIDVTRKGPRCLPVGVPVFLWRPEPRPEVELLVARTTATNVSLVTWPSGAATVRWPTDIAIVDGAAYFARQSGGESTGAIILKFIPAGLENSAQLAVWMEDVLCTEQALAVLRGIRGIGGAIELELSTDKGEAPVYRVGENLEFGVRVSQDAYIYCFYRQADGTVIKILPNQFAPNVRIPANFPYQFPDERMRFKLRLSKPHGAEAIICFAADRNVSDDLPSDVRSVDLAPLAGFSQDQLTEIFRSMSNVKISVAKLDFTVVE